ncbi:MAG: DUF4412 domain-containing protein [Candidatus Margulisiibacteriota bacterium]
MMKKTVLSALLALFALSGLAFALEFSADQVVKMKGMAPVTGKLNFSDNKWRSESKFMGKHTVSIIRADKKVSWTLMPDQKSYMENKLDPAQAAASGKEVPGEVKREKVGREKISGMDCDKYKITYKNAGGTSVLFLWMSKDGIPMKSASQDGSWSSEMKNVKVGRQAPSLFELPAGYKKMSVPSAGKMPSKADMDAIKKMMKDYR